MPLYRAEVTWSGTSQNNANASFFLTARDSNETWAVEGRRDTSVGAAQFLFYFNADTDPGLGSLISGTNTLTGPDFMAYDNGGTVAIEKDTDAGTITFVSPLGNQTRNLSAFGADDDTVLRPHAHGIQITRLTPLTQDSDVQVKFSDFYGKKDGQAFLGASLASTDPGIFSDFSFANFGLPANPTVPQDNAQEAAAYRMRFIYVNATDNPKSPGSREWRSWEGNDNLGFNPYGIAVDAVRCPVSGALYALRIAQSDPEEVFFAVSRDQGATWEEQTLHALVGATMVWPTLDVDPRGRILAFWQNKDDPTTQYWAISETFGKTWSAVSSAVGPHVSTVRARFHPVSGHLLYVYREPMEAQYKAVAHQAYDLVGFTPAGPWSTPVTIIEGATDHWPALTFNFRGQSIVQWSEGDRVIVGSDAYGLDWVGGRFETGTTKHQVALWLDEASTFHYVLYQDATSGDLFAFVAWDNGQTPAADGGVVLAGAEQQYAAIVTDTRGHAYVLYQELVLGSYVLRCRKSDSFAALWSDA